MNVSILTPTYNRSQFLTLLGIMIENQTYSLEKIEWIILDDSLESNHKWFENHPLQNKLHRIYYEHLPNHIPIGHKRNLTKNNATGDILIHMDDDDYYGMNYIETIVNTFNKSTKIQIVGASEIYLIFPELPFLCKSGPFHKNHTCGGFMAYRKEYSDTHEYNQNAIKAEERSFLNNYNSPIYQIVSSYNIYMAIVHQNNTVNKYRAQRSHTNIHWLAYINYPEIVMFYTSLSSMSFEEHYLNKEENKIVSQYSGYKSNIILRFLTLQSIIKITVYLFLSIFSRILHLYNNKFTNTLSISKEGIHIIISTIVLNKKLERKKIIKKRNQQQLIHNSHLDQKRKKYNLHQFHLQRYNYLFSYAQKCQLNNNPHINKILITYATYVHSLNM